MYSDKLTHWVCFRDRLSSILADYLDQYSTLSEYLDQCLCPTDDKMYYLKNAVLWLSYGIICPSVDTRLWSHTMSCPQQYLTDYTSGVIVIVISTE